jgi:hypothetical protein
MGLHTDTEIYRTTYELFRVTTEAIRNMPRDVKMHMGGKIRDEVLEAIDAIYMANVARNKVPHIENARRRIARIEVLLRQSVDMKFIVRPTYARAVELTRSAGRQATAWLKHSASHAPVT